MALQSVVLRAFGSRIVTMPRLLVSVRNSREAEAALNGGADLIDIKEPRNGPLGRAHDSVIDSIVRTVDGRAPISAACGELDLDAPRLPHGLVFAKFGLAGWKGRGWISSGERIRATLPLRCGFVAVAYADWQTCSAPSPDEIANAAAVHRFGAFLIDTYDKVGGSLLDHLSIDTIHDLIDRCQSAGVPVALAGSLGLDEIERLVSVRPAWFAVRGAACDGGRNGTIDSKKVRRLKSAIAKAPPSQTRVGAKV
jgi:(5-formylfuran-3-yl)methyl phosphate synthase